MAKSLAVSLLVALTFMLPGEVRAERSRAGDSWMFGSRCRLTWDATAANLTFTQDPSIATGEGSAVVSDPVTGAPLLYTDGIFVWNGSGTTVYSGLPGDPSTMHSAVVVPVPGASGNYYVFAHNAGSSSSIGYLQFSTSAGLTPVGSPASVTLPAGQGREGMLYVPHANGVDAWVLVSGASSIFVIPVTASGVGAAQTVSSDLSVWANGWHVFASSAQGTTVVMSGNSSTGGTSSGDLAAWTFDPATGQLSNRRLLNAGYRRTEMYGGAFSPNGRRFYFSVLTNSNGVGELIQYDFDTQTFVSLATGTQRYYFGDARRGPDGRLYIAGSQNGNALHVVTTPDAAGAAAGFLANAVTPPAGCTVSLGLPQTPLPRVLARPIITQSPSGIAVFATQPLSLSVTATGEQLAYQWRKGGADIDGANAATFATTATLAHAGDYDVVVSNSGGSVTSDAATVIVFGPPTISAPPVGTSIFATQSLTLSVTATGEQLAYQWRKASIDIEGAQAATFTTTAALTDAGDYDVVVSNPAGSATSAAATVVIHGPPAISVSPVDVTAFATQAFTLSVTATGEQLAYQWRKNGDDIEGANAATFMRVASLADAGDYDVVVTNAAGSTTSGAATVAVYGPPTIVTEPADVGVALGAVVSLEVTAEGQQLTYQWRKDGIELPGETARTLVRSSSAASDAGRYLVVVTNPAGAVTSREALVSVAPTDEPLEEPETGCGCSGSEPAPLGLVACMLFAVMLRRRPVRARSEQRLDVERAREFLRLQLDQLSLAVRRGVPEPSQLRRLRETHGERLDPASLEGRRDVGYRSAVRCACRVTSRR